MESPTKVTFLPVVDDGRLQGLISLHGLVSAGL
jgi:CBS domain-containing protein